ncbi:MAG TPA: ABC transporter permease [Actinomycetota bacterium]|nr:ABC transporter permease [Actinomycetota bacterium]
MSAAAGVPVGAVSATRARATGIFFLVVAAAIALLFGLGSGPGEARFGLNLGGRETFVTLPDLVVPVRATAFVLAAACAFLGGVQLTRGFGRRTNLVLGAVIALFVFAFLAWAARGDQMNLLGMLKSTLLRSVPITFGALSGVLCERAGVINIAIEGMLLSGALAGTVAASVTDDLWIGLAVGAVVGGLMGWALGVLAIRYQVDQIIAGFFLYLLALGLTSFLSARFLQQNQQLNNPGRFQELRIPVLSDLPILGPVLFDNNVFVYLMFALIAAIHVGLFATTWGLRVRAVGEHPRAADTVGIRVLATRYRNVILGGMVAGIGGAFFTLGSVGRFDEGMTAGKGFIGLAAMIFGRWNPIGAFGAALVFGFADSLQTKLSILGVPIPSEFLLMAPYLATILVVAGVVRRARPPAADGQPYVKE